MVPILPVLAALAESDCERLQSGLLAQPVNALSSLAYVAVGLWLLRRSRGQGTLVAVGIAMLGAGQGSFAYHGPQPGWAHVVHDGSALILVALIAGATVWHTARASTRRLVFNAWKAAAPWTVLAVAAYVAGRSGSPWCRPSSIWQPHAAWHVLSALGLGAAAALVSRPAGRRGAAWPAPRPSCSRPEPS
jgi:hypothetical protein